MNEAGDHFLSRAGFALQKHSRVSRGYLSTLSQYLPPRWRLSDYGKRTGLPLGDRHYVANPAVKVIGVCSRLPVSRIHRESCIHGSSPPS
jgi:hypothetical protein